MTDENWISIGDAIASLCQELARRRRADRTVVDLAGRRRAKLEEPEIVIDRAHPPNPSERTEAMGRHVMITAPG